jgi:hypothetical protein
MTAHPADPGTVLEVKNMADQKQDALDVLGEDAAELVAELDAATTKAQPEGAIVKAEDVEPEPEEAAEKADIEPEPEPEPAPDQLTMEQLQSVIEQLFTAFGEQLNERLAPTEAAIQQVAEMKAQIDALGATETEKVQAAIDSGTGDWFTELVKSSVQRRESVKDQSGPKQAADLNDPYFKVFPGLAPKD